MIVVLPAPFAPTIVTVSPTAISNEQPRTALIAP